MILLKEMPFNFDYDIIGLIFKLSHVLEIIAYRTFKVQVLLTLFRFYFTFERRR